MLRHANPQMMLPAQSVFKNLATSRVNAVDYRLELAVANSLCNMAGVTLVYDSPLAPSCKHCWVFWLLYYCWPCT